MSSTSSSTDAARRARIELLAAELYGVLRECRVVSPLSTRVPPLDIDDAYRIALGLLERRLASGERLIGKKIGATSRAVQDMLGVHQPDFGFLTATMQVPDGGSARIAANLIQPHAEAEIALILARGLKGPGVTAADVLAATESIAACFEVVDSRIENWNIGIVDTVADNASCGVFVLGRDRASIRAGWTSPRSRSGSTRTADRCRRARLGGAGLAARVRRLAREHARRVRGVARRRRHHPVRLAGPARARGPGGGSSSSRSAPRRSGSCSARYAPGGRGDARRFSTSTRRQGARYWSNAVRMVSTAGVCYSF